jgi:C1A family cysteine protease
MIGKHSPKTIGLYCILLIMLLSAVFVEGDPSQKTTAPERQSEPPPIIPQLTVEQVQAMVAQNGYNYAVRETWVSALPPEEQARLLGYIPHPMDLSHLTGTPGGLQDPPPFDYRTAGVITPPKDQGTCGSCWAFAGMGSVESQILLENGPEYDLSEENVLSCNVLGAGCGGGDDFVVVNYLTKEGASLESCAPYDAADGTPCATCDIITKLSGWRIIGTNLDTEDPTDIDIVKQALQNYGPLFVSMNGSAPGFSMYSGGVFEYWGAGGVNHAVMLIGWDDTMVHSHGTGAWIAKNSWGTSWGEGGYFNIAYGSARICEYVSVFSDVRNYDDEETLYYYDEAGLQTALSTDPPSRTVWGANRFIPGVNGTLEKIEFWTTDDVLNYEIRVYDTMTGSSPYSFSGLLTSQSGSTTTAGYYSIDLTTPVDITAGNDFIVAVQFDTPNYDYPVPSDDTTPISRESYFSSNGTSWYNLVDLDIGIRAVVGRPLLRFSGHPGNFGSNAFFVVGNEAYCTDVLGTGKIAYGLADGGVTENPEGRTHTILTTVEHDTGNLMIVGGPAINPVADEFDIEFGITYTYIPDVSFEIFSEGQSILLDLTQYPNQDICIVYSGTDNGRNIMLVWGYGWQGTYAGSTFMGDPANWAAYPDAYLLLLRWTDGNGDGLVQMGEIAVESSV